MFSKKDLQRLIIPLIIEQFLAITIGMADTVMVSSCGEAAVSGVSLVDAINILLINIFSALATGGAIISSQYIGREEPHKACEAAKQLVLSVFVLSMVIGGICVFGGPQILGLIYHDVERAVMDNAEIYFFLTALSYPFIALYNAGAALFRAMGNSKVSMTISIIMNCINVGGNAIFIFGFNMGAAGAALATLISRIVGAIFILILLKRPVNIIHVDSYLHLEFRPQMVKNILEIGIPNGLENGMFQLGKIAVLSLVSGLGTASLAANAVGNNIANFAILPGMSFGFALLTVCAQCVGAGDFEQVKYYTKHMMRVEYLCLIASNLIVILALPFILSVYNLSDEAAQYANDIILYHAACVVTIWPLSFTLPNTLRAAADVKVTMVLSIISMWVFRFGFSYLLTMVFHMGIFGVWVAMTIDWLVRGIFFVCRYRSGRWQKIIFS